MERGLSDLQKKILQFVAGRGKAYRPEVLRHCYGFPTCWKNGEFLRSERDGSLLHYARGAQNFCPRMIGRRKYAAANASLTRAISRLRDRGLVNGSIMLRLTDSGMELARTWNCEVVVPPPEEKVNLDAIAAQLRAHPEEARAEKVK
jgi:hypothetical protein